MKVYFLRIASLTLSQSRKLFYISKNKFFGRECLSFCQALRKRF